RVLHNESLTFEQRFETFTKGFNDCIANRNKQTGQNSVHYQDLHAVTIYLFFEYPEKYFGYKATMYTKMRDRIGFVETKSKQKNKTGKFENYTQMCELVLSEINADDELKKLSSSRLDDNCYKDEAYHLLTVDIIYYGGMKMEDADFKEETSQTEVINQLEESTTDSNDIVFDVPVTDVELNTILYGPPGTGKTYNTVIYAVAIIENKKLSQVEAEDYEQVFKRYNEYKKSGRVAFTTFHQSYGYEEFIEGIKPVIETDNESGGNSEIKYSVVPGIFKAFCENASGIKKPTISEINDLNELNQATKSEIKENFVFILDEINRGNISKIFGELITLIEPSKRIGADEEIEVLLPYSAKLFGIPNNIYIIGTMNTADRSIATIDTALRRRFYFKEMLPKPEVLKDVYVEDLSIGDMLARINKRITVLYDREHTIGHAYFMALKESPTIDTLARIFENNIIPLLQEYFYEDYEKIRLVLGDNQKDEQSQFIIAKPNNYIELFGNQDVDFDEGYNYEINKTAFDNVEAYRSI
ncbi:MAG: AAA family ATPase, partial [Clostridia bacterium]|nr:AAA family ATPase [Clostridia bacterium]